MANAKTNRAAAVRIELFKEVTRSRTITQIVEKFVGFKIPANIAESFAVATTANDFRIARCNLENVLVGFFKKSGVYFSKRLAGLRLGGTMATREQDAMKEIHNLQLIASAKWIDLAVAGDVYLAVHQMIDRLAEERNIRENLAYIRSNNGARLDADLAVAMKTIYKEIDALRYVTNLETLKELHKAILQKVGPIKDLQQKRLHDRDVACRNLRFNLATAKSA